MDRKMISETHLQSKVNPNGYHGNLLKHLQQKK